MSARKAVALCAFTVACGLWLASVAEAQPGTITATCTVANQTQACDSGWYTSPVTVVWQVTPPPQGASACGRGIGIQNPFAQDTSTTLSCSATWAGGSLDATIPLHLEISAPSATATPDRPPDVNGWYNHPLSVSFAGSAFSLIASCTPAQTYAGAATAGTGISGSCTDNAGKVATAGFPFRYDATPPTLTTASRPADGSVDLTWQASSGPAPLQFVQVSRDPAAAAAAATVLYQGAGTSFHDRGLRNGRRYTYTVTAVDQAGNATERTVTARPGIRLLGPISGARLKAPPTLNWTEMPKAAYYNVQLFKGRREILSAWPTNATLHLSRTWEFRGHRHRLVPGRYRWFVWPGFGSRKAARYGHVIGTAVFVIR